MTNVGTDELKDPDLFADELQYWLLATGPRSEGVRQLMRLARRHPGAELSRSFESKLAEYRRYRRESRRPTVWNLPARAFEAVWEDARFTPPVHAVTTLIYVVIVIFGLEGVRQYW